MFSAVYLRGRQEIFFFFIKRIRCHDTEAIILAKVAFIVEKTDSVIQKSSAVSDTFFGLEYVGINQK